MKILAFIICYLSLGFAQISGQIMIDSIPNKLNLLGNTHVKAVFSDRSTSFQEIRKHAVWQPYDSSFIASVNSSVWLHFEIENRSQDTVEVYLKSQLDYTTIYQQTDEGYKELKNGYYVALSERANKEERTFTQLRFPPLQKSQLYLRLDVNSENSRYPPIIYSERGYWKFSSLDYKEQQMSIGFLYFYIISLTTIFIFALVFWLRLRNMLYFYYLGYLFFQLIYGFLVLRSTSAPISNFFEHIPKLAFSLFEPVQFIFIGFYILFIMKLLQVKNYDRLLAKILFYLGLFCFLYALTNFVFTHFLLGGKYSVRIFYMIRYFILPLNFILIFWVIYKVKHPLLVYFIIGQSFFFIGAILSTYVAYNSLHFVRGHFFSFKESLNIIFQIGLLVEVYCFSLALGKNVFLLQREKEEATTALINQLKTNQLMQEDMNRELDTKVQKKTSELIALYSEIERERNQKIKDDFNIRIKETEMMALRSQMNPHFIFNSMNAIKNLIMTSRNEDAIAYLDDFASLLRGILQNSNRKKITVEEELEILELYLSLEQSRMGDNFNYTIQVDSKEALSQYQIPPLLLQPIVENAIWHGLQPSLKAEKKLMIIFDTTNDLKIIIEDNGIGRKESAKNKKLHNSMGTTIVQDRLTLYNHLNDHTIYLQITDLEDDDRTLGTRVTLTYKY